MWKTDGINNVWNNVRVKLHYWNINLIIVTLLWKMKPFREMIMSGYFFLKFDEWIIIIAKFLCCAFNPWVLLNDDRKYQPFCLFKYLSIVRWKNSKMKWWLILIINFKRGKRNWGKETRNIPHFLISYILPVLFKLNLICSFSTWYFQYSIGLR